MNVFATKTSTSVLIVAVIAACIADPVLADAPPLDYNRDVRPILSDNCFYCHGPDARHREADLRLDVEASATASAIVPFKPGESEFVARIVSDEADSRMPPPETGKQLAAAQIEILKQWISQGGRYDEYWAFSAPRAHSLPKLADDAWSAGPIDRFVLDRLYRERLRPAQPADRINLARRVSLDLTGLPPEPEAVEAFAADTRPDAYERLVDGLLASPRYGERMAAYWLDLVRYADTVGYHGDQDHNISPYRDYVIDAFNRDLPFDQFTREQLAGDLLPEPSLEQRIATGYNRLLQTTHEGGLQPKEYLAIYAADRVRNLSVVWMGATVGCAQCHDHKFDPYTQQDFYALAAFFADVDEEKHFTNGGNTLPTRREPEIVVFSAEQQRDVDALNQQIELIRHSHSQADSDEKNEHIQSLQEKIAAIEKHARRTMVTVSIKPRITRVLSRGNWMDESGPIVEPAIPGFLGEIPPKSPRANRLDLANWLIDCDGGNGGQTARVLANRLWYLLMGTGISVSLDDFGGQGQPPNHPELLDYLALQLTQSDWDVKHLIRQIVLSSTYQQSAKVTPELRQRDPTNRLFARQSSYRLSAEMVRDTALAVSGLLVLETGGDSVKPYQPAGYYRHLNFPEREYESHGDERQWRRGVYVHWQRQFLHPALKAFDAPSREECTAERPRSNTPLAALVLLNDPSFVEAARGLATRICMGNEDSDKMRLANMFRHVLSREPDSLEGELLLSLLDENRRIYQLDVNAAQTLLATGLSTQPKNIALSELAAWTYGGPCDPEY